jgi:hypothetical protein
MPPRDRAGDHVAGAVMGRRGQQPGVLEDPDELLPSTCREPAKLKVRPGRHLNEPVAKRSGARERL